MATTALRKSAEYERYFQELGNSPQKIFESMKDVFMFAASLGFKNNKKVPFQKAAGENISLRFFKDDDRNIMDIIALQDTNDISILLNDDEYVDRKYKIIEEYANGGMGIMVEAFCKPIADEDGFRRFIESFDEDSGVHPISSLEDILERAIDSI
jgi:dnd system-associated protein 4